MKHLLVLGTMWGALALALPAAELRVGAVAGLSAWGAEVLVEGSGEWFDDLVMTEFGLEAGLANGTPRVLVPVGLAFEQYLEEGWSFGVAAHGLLGSTFAAMTPSFVGGGELELRAEYAQVPGIAFGFSLAGRYVGTAWEFPLRLMLEIPVGGHDALEVDFEDHGDDHGENHED